MLPFLPSIITGGASLLGGLIANAGQRHSAKEAMRFSERMSNTAYQRMARDMRAAGINPIVGFSSGGASTPQGVSPQIGDVIGPAVNSALSANREAREGRFQNVQAGGITSQNTLRSKQEQLADKQRQLLDKNIERAGYENMSAKQMANFSKTMGQAGPFAQFILQFIRALK